MSSSSSSTRHKYDVYVSFIWSDTGRTFVSHLHRSLVEKGVKVFRDEMEKTRLLNNEIHPIPTAIGMSKTAIVVVSENYASSGWCLQELIEVLKFRRKGSLMVLPVYYGVDPRDVKRQTRKFGQQFWQRPVDETRTWTEALTELSGIVGEESDKWTDDMKLIQKITDVIWDQVNVSRFRGLVGLNLHQERINRLLTLNSESKQVREIGIYGSGGIGKTALARYIYQWIPPNFNIRIRLEDANKIYGDPQSELIARSAFQRVLLIVDGVNTIAQIDTLRRLTKELGSESRIIITCSDERLLLACGIKHLYQLQPMASSEALQLLCSCAFRQLHIPVGFEKVSDRAIKLAFGIPLVIVTLGSELFGRSLEECEMVLSRYENEASYDEDSKGVVKSSTFVSDVSKVSGRSKEEWKMVLSKYEPLYDDDNTETKISSFVSEHEDRSKNTAFTCVGMDCRLPEVSGLMELESDNEVRIVGIWGVGGVGKTTLARCVCDETTQHFHSHVFLESIGKIYQDHGTLCLGEEILWESIQKSSKNLSDVTKARLGYRKLLLVIDGVDNNKQMEDVRKVALWLGAGSRVIVTTREEKLLVDNGIKHVYKVECLKLHEALQLFYQFAFMEKNPTTRFKQLSVHAVQLTGRIPLALRVLGSLLRYKSENDWKSVLHELERQQYGDIEEEAEIPSDVEVSGGEGEDEENSVAQGMLNTWKNLDLQQEEKNTWK